MKKLRRPISSAWGFRRLASRSLLAARSSPSEPSRTLPPLRIGRFSFPSSTGPSPGVGLIPSVDLSEASRSSSSSASAPQQRHKWSRVRGCGPVAQRVVVRGSSVTSHAAISGRGAGR
eukprot:3349834-Prymnesium_polylepis.2